MNPRATLGDALHTAAMALARSSASPQLDAEWLLAHATGLSRARIRGHTELVLDDATARRYEALIARRARGEPIAYILGEWEFWSLPLEITPDVLVPRPATELLVELALALLPADRPCAVLDLGTGSGAIAIAIASERPLARVTAVDRSASVLTVAARNVARHVPGRVELLQSDWFARLGARSYAVIVANPPYVAVGDPSLEPAVAEHEPAAALLAGPAGLDALEAIASAAPAHLEPGATLLLEHGATQGVAVRALLEAAGFSDVSSRHDLAGHDRVTSGRWPG